MRKEKFVRKVYDLAEEMGYFSFFIAEVITGKQMVKLVKKAGGNDYCKELGIDPSSLLGYQWDGSSFNGIVFNGTFVKDNKWKRLQPYVKHEIAHLITGLGDDDPKFMEFCELNEIAYYYGTEDGEWKYVD